jgi:hypothetical protein
LESSRFYFFVLIYHAIGYYDKPEQPKSWYLADASAYFARATSFQATALLRLTAMTTCTIRVNHAAHILITLTAKRTQNAKPASFRDYLSINFL